MVFNSASFLVFFGLFYFIFWILNNKSTLAIRNIFIILSSYLFYGWWDWRFLSLIIFSSAVDFSIGILLKNAQQVAVRKGLLASSIIINIGILVFFKYFNFFIDSLNNFLTFFSIEAHTTTLSIILPVGISFYTFQTLSYTIDVYKKRLTPTTDVLSFFAFVSFFPQLVAGPIERASHLLQQFTVKKSFHYSNNVEGLRLVLWGFFKKIVIADNFGVLADALFNSETPLNGFSVLAGGFFFALQIYADFSGYSDIAIGISRMLGFDLMTNFSTPYFAHSFSNFWERWHISLSTWFRDYVYIPLGGNRRPTHRVYFNIFVTFLLSGLWHGANVTFLIWGALHGLMLIIEKKAKIKSNNLLYAPFVILVVVLLWIPFRAENSAHLKELTIAIGSLSDYSLSHLTQIIHAFSLIKFTVLCLVLTFFLWIEYNMNRLDFSQWIALKAPLFRKIMYYLFILLLLLIGNFSVKPSFIYFQF